MSLRQRIPEDIKSALKNKKTVELSTLRMLQAAVINREIDKKRVQSGLSDEEIIEVVGTELKKRKEAAEAFIKGGRADLADGERAEAEVLMAYMPKQMTDAEIREEVIRAIAEAGARSAADLGRVMRAIAPRTKGKADGALVNKIVKEELEKSSAG
ncbi:MAG: GatB/YqeY domain-containing protein [Deltaproteobacteria bacterium]